jgi:hypothetical protein
MRRQGSSRRRGNDRNEEQVDGEDDGGVEVRYLRAPSVNGLTPSPSQNALSSIGLRRRLLAKGSEGA